MTDESASFDAGRDPDQKAEESELFRRLEEMFAADAPPIDPPAMVAELARQSFALRADGVELALLTADSHVEGTAAAVRRSAPPDSHRLLSFATGDLLVELEVTRPRRPLTPGGTSWRLLGELLPPGPARIEVRQPGGPARQWIDTDEDGRFVIDALRPGPFSLTCRRPGAAPVATEWTLLD